MLYLIFIRKLTRGHEAGAKEKGHHFPWIFSCKAGEMRIHQRDIGDALRALGLYAVLWMLQYRHGERMKWTDGSDERDRKLNPEVCPWPAVWLWQVSFSSQTLFVLLVIGYKMCTHPQGYSWGSDEQYTNTQPLPGPGWHSKLAVTLINQRCCERKRVTAGGGGCSNVEGINQEWWNMLYPRGILHRLSFLQRDVCIKPFR